MSSIRIKRTSKGKQTEKQADDSRIERLRFFQKAHPENKRCCDCHERGPQYICLDFNTYICMACSGLHREFSHRVKSLSMSKFTDLEVENFIKYGGNAAASKFWRTKLQKSPPDHQNKDKVRNFIRKTYIERVWVLDESPRKPKKTKKKSFSFSSSSSEEEEVSKVELKKKKKKKSTAIGSQKKEKIVNLFAFDDDDDTTPSSALKEPAEWNAFPSDAVSAPTKPIRNPFSDDDEEDELQKKEITTKEIEDTANFANFADFASTAQTTAPNSDLFPDFDDAFGGAPASVPRLVMDAFASFNDDDNDPSKRTFLVNDDPFSNAAVPVPPAFSNETTTDDPFSAFDQMDDDKNTSSNSGPGEGSVFLAFETINGATTMATSSASNDMLFHQNQNINNNNQNVNLNISNADPFHQSFQSNMNMNAHHNQHNVHLPQQQQQHHLAPHSNNYRSHSSVSLPTQPQAQREGLNLPASGLNDPFASLNIGLTTSSNPSQPLQPEKTNAPQIISTNNTNVGTNPFDMF